MKVQIKVYIDESAIQEALQALADSISEVSGVGADGESTYEVMDATVDPDEGHLSYTVTFDMDRTSGKFASKDEVGEALEAEFVGNTVEVVVEQ